MDTQTPSPTPSPTPATSTSQATITYTKPPAISKTRRGLVSPSPPSRNFRMRRSSLPCLHHQDHSPLSGSSKLLSEHITTYNRQHQNRTPLLPTPTQPHRPDHCTLHTQTPHYKMTTMPPRTGPIIPRPPPPPDRHKLPPPTQKPPNPHFTSPITTGKQTDSTRTTDFHTTNFKTETISPLRSTPAGGADSSAGVAPQRSLPEQKEEGKNMMMKGHFKAKSTGMKSQSEPSSKHSPGAAAVNHAGPEISPPANRKHNTSDSLLDSPPRQRTLTPILPGKFKPTYHLSRPNRKLQDCFFKGRKTSPALRNRAYSKRFLRQIKNSTLASLAPTRSHTHQLQPRLSHNPNKKVVQGLVPNPNPYTLNRVCIPTQPLPKQGLHPDPTPHPNPNPTLDRVYILTLTPP
ncbi:hypothetical protein D5F01_LYC24987 [Larimichthys crocea]|uniref:Uncharacterized protein n=1 Tax=Larimichthys crocea TaxID=215358 RepID=A0A6G0HD79_LARCR|nr:hypothetical protein D5F01_LYC24987 [Larimichthys crocea]